MKIPRLITYLRATLRKRWASKEGKNDLLLFWVIFITNIAVLSWMISLRIHLQYALIAKEKTVVFRIVYFRALKRKPAISKNDWSSLYVLDMFRIFAKFLELEEFVLNLKVFFLIFFLFLWEICVVWTSSLKCLWNICLCSFLTLWGKNLTAEQGIISQLLNFLFTLKVERALGSNAIVSEISFS